MDTIDELAKSISENRSRYDYYHLLISGGMVAINFKSLSGQTEMGFLIQSLAILLSAVAFFCALKCIGATNEAHRLHLEIIKLNRKTSDYRLNYKDSWFRKSKLVNRGVAIKSLEKSKNRYTTVIPFLFRFRDYSLYLGAFAMVGSKILPFYVTA